MKRRGSGEEKNEYEGEKSVKRRNRNKQQESQINPSLQHRLACQQEAIARSRVQYKVIFPSSPSRLSASSRKTIMRRTFATKNASRKLYRLRNTLTSPPARILYFSHDKELDSLWHLLTQWGSIRLDQTSGFHTAIFIDTKKKRPGDNTRRKEIDREGKDKKVREDKREINERQGDIEVKMMERNGKRRKRKRKNKGKGKETNMVETKKRNYTRTRRQREEKKRRNRKKNIKTKKKMTEIQRREI